MLNLLVILSFSAYDVFRRRRELRAAAGGGVGLRVPRGGVARVQGGAGGRLADGARDVSLGRKTLSLPCPHPIGMP